MSGLQVFNFESKNVRLLQYDQKTWFAAKDVCEILDIKNTTDALKRLEYDEVTRFNLGSLSGETNFVNEYGLYSLVLGSRKPEAKKFKRWVTHEVIPSIRKHGAYMTPEKIEEVLLNPDTIIQLAQNLKAEQEKRVEAERIIAEQQPLVEFANTIANDKRGILIRDFAKVISKQGLVIGEKRLFQWMRTNGYLMRNNRPYQRYIDMGVLELVERPVVRTAGTEISFTPKITGKGQEYFYSKLREELRAVSV